MWYVRALPNVRKAFETAYGEPAVAAYGEEGIVSAYLGARLLQLPLLFLAAHAASFPGWPADAGG